MTEGATATDDPILELRGAAKSFGHVIALHHADLEVHPGEVLAIVGDNGAGKSTMLKVLSGLYRPDGGDLRVGGRSVSFANPAEARQAGIATVYQDLALVECLDIATNLHLGDVPRRGPFVDRRRMEREAEQTLQTLNVRVGSVRTPVGLLSGGQRQIIAISRAVRLDSASIILLDEPTAALGVQERGHVGDIIEQLRRRGKAVIIICHDLEFVFHYADTVTVMCLGRTVATRRARDTTREDVIAFITGARTAEAAV